MFHVNEIFTSIQGEGSFTGVPAHFIRFQGCPIRCWFCDSKTTWDMEAAALKLNQPALLEAVAGLRAGYPHVRHMVLTGGEPLWRNPGLPCLIRRLRRDGLAAQIETSGLQPWPDDGKEPDDGLFITVSPKAPDMETETYLPVDENVLRAAFEIKFPVTGSLDIEKRIPAFLNAWPRLQARQGAVRIYLQPADYGERAKNAAVVRLCVEAAKQNNWLVSVQAHKVLGIP